MKYPKLKAAADAERKKQGLVSKILDQESNKLSKTALLAMDVSELEKLEEPVNEPKKEKRK
jgi:hypothetical protein